MIIRYLRKIEERHAMRSTYQRRILCRPATHEAAVLILVARNSCVITVMCAYDARHLIE
jgi:hypothetical protein